MGVTRARDPVAAVRRALRDDTRVFELADGRLASVDQALAGLELTTRVTGGQERDGRIEVEPDLAPLAVLGLGPVIDLPAGVRAGEVVAVRVDDPSEREITVRAIGGVSERPGDEAAVVARARQLLAPPRDDAGWAPPPVVHLATVALAVAADDPAALRAPGRPLSEVVTGAGLETHMGWVGEAGTDWAAFTEDEASVLETEVAGLLTAQRPGDAAVVQDRLLSMLRRHLPGRVPTARRRMAHMLARAGRPGDAVGVLVGGGSDDPEDWYEAAVVAHRAGQETRARRWVQAGLARLDGDAHADVGACLTDLEGDLDAQDRYLAARAGLSSLTPDPAGAAWLADAVAGLGRAYLVEALLEELAAGSDRVALDALIRMLAATAGAPGRDVCLAMGRVLPRGIARRARAAVGHDAEPAGDAVAGLVDSRPDRAWSTRAAAVPGRRQIIVTVTRGGGRVAPLVALVGAGADGGMLDDALFLPDMVHERLRRELLDPMREFGLECRPMPVGDAVAGVVRAMELARGDGRRLPSLDHQPVVERIGRYLISP